MKNKALHNLILVNVRYKFIVYFTRLQSEESLIQESNRSIQQKKHDKFLHSTKQLMRD